MIHRTILTLLVLCTAFVAVAEESARQWLERMLTAERYLNYEGTFVYISGPDVETLQVVHSFDKNGVRERVTSISGNSKEIVRDDKRLFWVSPAQRMVLIESIDAQEPQVAVADAFRKGNAYYELVVGGKERIADHPCQIVSIFPKDQYRYGYRLCIEDETGLLLKAQTIDKSGQPKEQMMFTSITLPDNVPTERLSTTVTRKDFAVLQARDPPADSVAVPIDPRWRLTELPPGFLLTRNVMRRIASSTQPVQHIVLEDGVASISIFIAPAVPGEPYSEGVLASGGLSAASRKLRDHVVTVLGEVPEGTVKMVANALVYDDGTQPSKR